MAQTLDRSTVVSSTPPASPSTRRLPPVVPGHPIAGSAFTMRRDPLRFLLDATHRYGEISRIRFFFSYAYMVNSAEGARHILQEHNRNYDKNTFDNHALARLLGKGLLTNDGAPWLRQRRLIQPAFHRQRLASFAAIMTGAAERTAEAWRAASAHGEPTDVAAEMMRLTLSVVGQALFGQNVEDDVAVVGRAGVSLSRIITDYVMRPLPPLDFPSARGRHFRAAKRELDAVTWRIIAERRRTGADTGDLLSMLLTARDEEGHGMDDQQVRDEVLTLLLAGHETTSTLLSWTWYLLSRSPDAERRLHEELATVLGGRIPGVDDLAKLPYTRRVLDESLRLYPPAWSLARNAVADDTIGGYTIPAHAAVILCPYTLHRHPDYWIDPERFDPDRFLPERVEARPRWAYIPFGGGPRQCIGNSFALMEAQLALATLAQRFQPRLAPGHTVLPEPVITLRPRDGLQMIIEAR